MPLGVRDILLVVRAKDQATRILTDIGKQFGGVSGKAEEAAMASIKHGAALLGIGIGIASIGAEGVKFFLDAIDAAKKYNQEAALTLTQVDQLGVSLETIKDIGRNVAAAIPAPFEQMQSSLYDIFSSMDVNVHGAQALLTGFAKAAVAGQVDVQTAGRATIAIMNGFKIPVEDVNKVLDIQFEAVRKGVFTYDEFATAIGRAIPSAQKAGQSVETLAGMMAFLTRNGLSADQAATSTARAFDLLSNPTFANRMHKFGIEVYDAAGNVRPMLDVVSELRSKLSTMTPEEANAKLAALTKGAGGTIQAMRFLNLAIHDSNGLFGQLVADMGNASGSMDAAYNIMLKQPQTQAQLLSNNIKILKTQIGDVFIPVLGKAVQVGIKLLSWFQNLNPQVKTAIIIFAAITSVLMLITGVIIAAAGAFMILNGALALLGIELLPLLGTVALVIAVVIALAAAAYLIYANWDSVAAFFAGVWDKVKDYANNAWQFLQGLWDWVTGTFVGLWQPFADASIAAWEAVKQAVSASIDFIVKVIRGGVNLIHTIASAISSFFEPIVGWFETVFGPGVMQVFGAVASFFQEVGGELYQTLLRLVSYFQAGTNAIAKTFQWLMGNIIGPFAKQFMALMKIIVDLATTEFGILIDVFSTFGQVWGNIVSLAIDAGYMLGDMFGILYDIINFIFGAIRTLIETVVAAIILVWEHFGGTLTDITKNTFNFMANIVTTGINVIKDVINVILNVIQGDWGSAWDAIKQVFIDTWNGIWNALQIVWSSIRSFFMNFGPNVVGFIGDMLVLLYHKGGDIMQGLLNGLVSIWGNVTSWLAGLKDLALNFFVGAINWLFDVGKKVLQGLWNGMKSIWNDITGWLSSLDPRNWFNDINVQKGHAITNLHETGRLVMQGLHNGMIGGWDEITSWLQTLDPSVAMAGAGNIGLTNNSTTGITLSAPIQPIQIAEGAIQVNGVQDPLEAAKQTKLQLEELIRELQSR